MNATQNDVGSLVRIKDVDGLLSENVYLLIGCNGPYLDVIYDGRRRRIHHTRVFDAIPAAPERVDPFREHWSHRRSDAVNHILVAGNGKRYLCFSLREREGRERTLILDAVQVWRPGKKLPKVVQVYPIRNGQHYLKLSRKWRHKGYSRTELGIS